MAFRKSFFISGFVLALLAFVSMSYLLNKNDKIAYIELSKVLPAFKLKQELENKLSKITQERKVIIDSMEFELKVLSKQIQSENLKDKSKVSLFEVKRDDYLEKKKQFEDDNVALAKKFDEQIFSQLNQYVKDYGEKFGYAYILGADGSGTLMYADDTNNITEAVKKFINDRYEGNTK